MDVKLPFKEHTKAFADLKLKVSKKMLIICKDLDDLKALFKNFYDEQTPKLKDFKVFKKGE